MNSDDRRTDALAKLKQRFAVLADLGQIGGLLGWDQHTCMPERGGPARGQQMATLSAVSHEKLTDPAVGRWLAELEDAELSGDDAAFLRLARRQHDRAVKLPPEFVERFASQRSRAQQVWAAARRDDDFARFAPELQRMVELNRQQAEYLGYDEHPYDALHDLYEPGSTVRRLQGLFDPLRRSLVGLLGDLRASGRTVDEGPLYGDFDESKQEAFAVAEIRRFGYDFRGGRLDRAVHPFAQGIANGDVRITTRYRPNNIYTSLFATFHEAGHAIYEQGLPEELERSPVGAAVSLGVHESQSRLWENLVGRSERFWRGAFGRLREAFPSALEGVAVEEFHAAVNRVRPSLIRVEADEITYNLHVMIRFELELAMLEGSLAVDELPGAWNERYRELLGIAPDSDAEGCLQDIHWSMGAIGYFPTYTLGNLMSVQLYEAARRQLGDLGDDIERGDFHRLLGWLREHVHRHGSRFEPDELLRRATGHELDSGPYLRYLDAKFRRVYGLQPA